MKMSAPMNTDLQKISLINLKIEEKNMKIRLADTEKVDTELAHIYKLTKICIVSLTLAC